MGDTSIEWTDKTWNPTRGCSLVSAGCTHCYAMKQAHRFSGPGGKYEGLTRPGANGPIWTGKVRLAPQMLDAPLRWTKPRRIFVDSMSDLFHEDVPDDFIAAVFGVMAMTPRHTYQILTKRADRLPKWFEWLRAEYDGPCDQNAVLQTSLGQYHRGDYEASDDAFEDMLDADWPLPNVWIGVSVEDQATADERIPHLLRAPAAVRFLSIEPLLSPVRLNLMDWYDWADGSHCVVPRNRSSRPDWVIVGGESGPKARPMHPDWARSIRDQCVAAGVPYFFKQWGEWCPVSDDTPTGSKLVFVHELGGVVPAASPYEPGCPCDSSPREAEMVRVGKKAAGRRLDGRTWDEFPEVA